MTSTASESIEADSRMAEQKKFESNEWFQKLTKDPQFEELLSAWSLLETVPTHFVAGVHNRTRIDGFHIRVFRYLHEHASNGDNPSDSNHTSTMPDGKLGRHVWAFYLGKHCENGGGTGFSGGTAHGGAIATVLDGALAVLDWNGDIETPVVTAQLEINYRKPVPLDKVLFVDVRVASRQGSSLSAEARIVDGLGPNATLFTEGKAVLVHVKRDFINSKL